MSAEAYNAAKKREIAALRALGWLPWSAADCGSLQFAADCKQWQQQANAHVGAGLAVDGACGPETWASLRSMYAPREWLRAIPVGLRNLELTYGKVREVPPVRVDIFAGSGRRIAVHPLLAAEIPRLLEVAAERSGYVPRDVQSYNVRRKRGGGASSGVRDWSTHSWAIALDIDPPLNPWGNKPSAPLMQHPAFLATFRAAGWSVGADWRNPDTMHVQAVRGY